MPGARSSLAATCEDYNSDDSEVVNGTRLQAHVVGQPNVATKRSHNSDLGIVKPVEVVGPDAASDSGYSSHTAATRLYNSQPAARAQPEKTTGSPGGPQESEQPEQSKKTTREIRLGDSKIERQRRAGVHPLSPLDSGLELNFPPFDQPPRSDRSPYTPPSPMSARQPAPYIQGSAVIQPAVSARRRSSSTSRARPVSYHAGVTPDTNYWAGGMQFPPTERGPPPSMSAHFNPPMPMMPPYSRMGATPPATQGFYPPGHPLQTTPPYDTQRPTMQQRTTSQYNTRRPTSTSYSARPLISYEQAPQQNSLVSARGPSARYNDDPPSSTFDSSSSSDDDEYDYDDEDTDRALMPPPKPKALPERRPSIRHANTTNSYNARLTQSQTLPERNREREPRFARSANVTTNNSRASSVRRPSVSRPSINGAAKAESYSNSNGNPKVTVESATSRRRQSYMGHEQHIELEAKHRDSEPPKDSAQAQTRRRQTDLDPRRRDAEVMETKKRDAEAYQRSRGDQGVQLTESSLKAVKRSSRIMSGGSDVGSMHSKASSNDRSSRISQASQSNRTTVTNANGEIKMRIDASTGVNLAFVGNMEGRTISLNPDGDTGYAELVIGAARGKETAYPSDRSSSVADRANGAGGRRLLQRYETEEASVRSRRSSRSGQDERERDRQPLGRRRRRIEE
ncbi:hypothetical protein AOQ84DRAFT_225043 [Glonium stellatum]|uniref:Uncharacterized protein n=1 Tax=Glonium stellatum TaxID=574774 RepID=A0A8E2JQE5_9PEZI|nr:hypothetical protein AOQ84DRAFT_225043 [Glonium stellatum]